MVISLSALVEVREDFIQKWNLKQKNFLAITTGRFSTKVYTKVKQAVLTFIYSSELQKRHCCNIQNLFFRKYNVALSKMITRLEQTVPKWLAEELRES